MFDPHNLCKRVQTRGQFFKAKLAPTRKVGAYTQSWRLRAKLAPTRKVGAYAQSWRLRIKMHRHHLRA
jgi:hypothetical protein